jgi:hypothetical protein
LGCKEVAAGNGVVAEKVQTRGSIKEPVGKDEDEMRSIESRSSGRRRRRRKKSE